MVWRTILTSYVMSHRIFHLHCPTPLKKNHMELNACDSELFMQFKTTCILSRISHTEGKVQIGNNQLRSPLWNIILFSWSLYLHLFKIKIYLWLGFIGDITEYQFVFCSKVWWNSIFGATNCWQISLIFALLEEQQ